MQARDAGPWQVEQVYLDNLQIHRVPEPGTLLLLAVGLGVGTRARKRLRGQKIGDHREFVPLQSVTLVVMLLR